MTQSEQMLAVNTPKDLQTGDLIRVVVTTSSGETKQMLYRVWYNPLRSDNIKEHRTVKFLIELVFIVDPGHLPAKSPYEYYACTGKTVGGLKYVEPDWFAKRNAVVVVWQHTSKI